MNINRVIDALEELSVWLNGLKIQQRVDQIIDRLRQPERNEFELEQIRFELSTEMLFNPKCLGDVYVADFVGDGTPFAWWHYISEIADICRKNLQ